MKNSIRNSQKAPLYTRLSSSLRSKQQEHTREKIAVNSYGNYTLFVENKASELMNDGCRVGEGKAQRKWNTHTEAQG